jgi:hypothetical protein
MNPPRVSIVTPSFNQAPFLENTILSVLGQDYAPIEYFIIDGASTDGSQQLIRRYAGRLAGWRSEADRGQADALRKGFALATGEIFAWVNSDDMLAPGAVAQAVAALQAHPEAGLVYGNAASMDADGRPLNDMRFSQYRLADLAAFQIICQPAVFMRRQAYEQAGGLDPGYHFLLDHHLWLRIAASWPIRHVDALWAFARQHPLAKNVAQAGRFGEEAHRIAGWLLEQGPAGANRAAVQAGALRFEARYLLDGREYLPALRSYWASLRTHAPSALKEWHRLLFAALGTIGLGALGDAFYRLKRRRPLASWPGLQQVEALYPRPKAGADE